MFRNCKRTLNDLADCYGCFSIFYAFQPSDCQTTFCNSSSTYFQPIIENILSLLLLSRKNVKHFLFCFLFCKEMLSIGWCWCLRRCAEPAHITLDRKTWFKTLVAKSWKLIFSFKAQEDGVVRPISLVTRPIPFKWIYKANSFVLIWKFKICKITSLHNLDIQPLFNLDDLWCNWSYCWYKVTYFAPLERKYSPILVSQHVIKSKYRFSSRMLDTFICHIHI